MVKISASILSADFACLAEDCRRALDAGADWLHIDVMDGHFVPNISYGAPVLSCLHKALPQAYYDVHLMISDPAGYAADFARAGADSITFHLEAVPGKVEQTIQAIRSEKVPDGAETGISELDELMAFVYSKSNDKLLQNDHTLPPKIEELFHTFAERAKTLSSAERAILNYYIDGHEITEIPELAFISIHTVKKHNSNIYQKLGISSRDELMLYIDLFRRLGRLNELTEPV